MITKKGFTLIELLIVIGILAILMGAVVAAINPGRMFAQARNTQRWVHLDTLLNVVYQRMVDNKGAWPTGEGCDPLPTTTYKYITSEIGEDKVDLCRCFVPYYLPSLPYDPSASGAHYRHCGDYNTGYTIYLHPSIKRIYIHAPSAELGERISLSR